MHDQLRFIVEPMSLADVDQVIAIERVVFPAPWSVHAYRYEILKNQYSTMLVARQAPARSKWSGILGLLNLARPSPVLSYGGFWLLVDEAHISTIAVDVLWQGRGLGELLLLSLLDCGAEKGARKATLEVRVSNLAAQGLYHKYGFEIISRQKRYYADNNEDAYIMATPPFEAPEYRDHLRHCRARLYERLCATAHHSDDHTGSKQALD
jgi:ribosomal-protein-alanine N-acetyltransferase